MGDICNMNDIERISRSKEGQEFLEEFRQRFLKNNIIDVVFTNEICEIGIVFYFEDGTQYMMESFDIDDLRYKFKDVIEREYYIDYPDRKPKQEEKDLDLGI